MRTIFSDHLKKISERATPLLYSGSALASSAAQMVAGVLLVRWIVPEDMGVWRSAQLFQTYAFIMLMGINNGLSRELPYFLGKNDQVFSQKLAGASLFVTNAASSLVIVGGLGFILANRQLGTNQMYATIAMACMIPLAFYQNYFIVAYRSGDSFKKLTVIQFVEAGLSLATIPLVYYLHYAGMLFRTVAILAVVVFFMYRQRPFRAAPKLDLLALKTLFKTGLPIFWLDYVRNAAATVPTLVVLHFGGVESVGYFALSQIVARTLAVVPQSLSQYVYPRMTFGFGQNGDRLALWRMGFRFFAFAALLVLLASALAAFAIPYVVPAFAPKYQPGVTASQIILIAAVFETATVMVNALWSMKVWKLMVIYQSVSSILLILAPIAGVLILGKSLESVTWGMAVGSIVRCCFAIFLTYRATHSKQSSVATS